MTDAPLRLSRAPIIEAIVDIDCDLPPSFQIEAFDAHRWKSLAVSYPNHQLHHLSEFSIQRSPEGALSQQSKETLVGHRFFSADEKTIVQVRNSGFSFNRLAPYKSLDDYLPEIEELWRTYVSVVQPLQVREVRLRFVNRIPLPTGGPIIHLDQYFHAGPQLPSSDGLTQTGFFVQYSAIEDSTGNQLRFTLTNQPATDDVIPIVFDIETSFQLNCEPSRWDQMVLCIQSLRQLKNRVFKENLTKRCIELFQ